MKVIPVIDILNGIVVHAVKGRRQEYQPLKSILTSSVEPLEVAAAFKKRGFSDLYIADLDAITQGNVNFQLLKRIADETGLHLMVDAGVADLAGGEKLLDNGVSKVVIGTETLRNKDFVGEAVKFLGNERVIVSLDLKGNKVLIKMGLIGCINPMCFLDEFKEMGVSNVIVLDLSRVGSCEGVNVDFLKRALEKDLATYVGGGVRDIKDLVELKDIGISGALIATALHSGKISAQELNQNGLL